MSFTASSGNKAIFTAADSFDFEKNEKRTAVRIDWARNPSESDMREFDVWYCKAHPDSVPDGSIKIGDSDKLDSEMRNYLATGKFPDYPD
jgi:hypothetical protein